MEGSDNFQTRGGGGGGLKELGKLSKGFGFGKASLRFPREYIKQDYLGI